jgi:predicted DsbA family dithiol-disulfide isomerase
MHTYVAGSGEGLEDKLRLPLSAYIKSFLEQQKNVNTINAQQSAIRQIVEEDIEAFVELVFQRYYHHGSLIGTEQTCCQIIERVAQADVNEIACLIDFGLSNIEVMASLHRVAKLIKWQNAVILDKQRVAV